MSAKRKDLPLLTRAESEVMGALWKRGQATVHELMADLDKDVAYTTVLTLVRILEQKGYATHRSHPDGGRAHLYLPAVEEAGVRRSHVRDLVDRLFGGKAEALVTGLLDDEKLSRADLEALKASIDAKLGKGGRK
jgi:predicted transcriptional regulator